MCDVPRDTDKAALRRQIRMLRRGRDAVTRAALEVELCDQLAQLIPATARSLAAFVPVRGELGVRPWAADVMPRRVMKGAHATPRRNTAWCFPRCDGDALVFCRVTSADQWGTGRFQIPEPTTEALDAEAIEWLIMPALGCDRRGIRLGQGGGFYDRFLAAHPALWPRTVALVDEAGLFTHLPRDSWDIPVAYVVSPGETWRIDGAMEH